MAVEARMALRIRPSKGEYHVPTGPPSRPQISHKMTKSPQLPLMTEALDSYLTLGLWMKSMGRMQRVCSVRGFSTGLSGLLADERNV